MAENTREIIKWVMGVIAGILLFSIKYSVEQNTTESTKLKEKVDKVYDYTTNHEVRMAIMEKELDKQSQTLLNLQLSEQRWGSINPKPEHRLSSANP